MGGICVNKAFARCHLLCAVYNERKNCRNKPMRLHVCGVSVQEHLDAEGARGGH